MARRKPETLDDLLRPILDADRFTDWCEGVAKISPWTGLRLRQGAGQRVNRGTVLAVVAGLRAEGIEVDESRVAAAIAASRAAAGKD